MERDLDQVGLHRLRLARKLTTGWQALATTLWLLPPIKNLTVAIFEEKRGQVNVVAAAAAWGWDARKLRTTQSQLG